MKYIKKATALILSAAALILALGLSGCGEYTSSYKAIAFIHSNEPKSAFMTFGEFEGRMVFRLNNRDGGAGSINYSAFLESGSADVMISIGGKESSLFSIGSGESISADAGVGPGTVYIIVETEGKCVNGDLRFALEE